MKVMLAAGDPSGDVYGGALAEALRTLRPGVRLLGLGGPRMREAGVRLLYDLSALSTVGVVEALRNLPLLKRLLGRLGDVMDSQRPDVLVLIDFPGFNLKLGELAHSKGIPVVFYFSPSAWAWGKDRARQVARIAARVCTVLPMEDEVYREAGANVTYVGHPLLDLVRVTGDGPSLRRELGLESAEPMVALLPGSRSQEVRHLLPVMIRAAQEVHRALPGARFAVAVAHTFRSEELERIARATGVAEGDPAWPLWIEGRTYDVLAAAHVAVVASGTATLEGALLGTPLVVVYKVAPSTYALGKMLVKVPFLALPNLIAGRKVVPELLQSDASPTRIAEEVVALWKDPEARQAMVEAYGEIRARLGGPGATMRAAQVVLEVGGSR